MLFPTIDFALFFVVVFTASWLLRGFHWPWRVFMVVASLYFYGYWNWRYVPLILLSIAWNWTLASGASRSLDEHGQKTGRSRTFVAVAVVGNLALLAYFKYLIFFVDSAVSTINSLPLDDIDPPFLEILLPVGISFFTFQAMSYVIDVGRNDIDPMHPVDFALYVSFFPQLVAGPIVRATEFAPQLAQRPDPRHIRYAEAFRLIFAGLFKKVVISGYLASQIVDPVFDNPELESAPNILFAIWGYAIQIYADFSGYTDIAIGCALLLGFRFPQNFDAPYISRSIQEFWRRWHMTLSRWLRDYLYIPLGGNRGPNAFVYRNLFLTMLLGGLWHGAAWTFVIWGALHGTGLIAERSERLWIQLPVVAAAATPVLFAVSWVTGWGVGTFVGTLWCFAVIAALTGLAAKLEPFDGVGGAGWAARLTRWFVTTQVVCLAWVFFRAQSVDDALTMLHRLLTWAPDAGGPGGLITWIVVAIPVLAVLSQLVPQRTVHRAEDVYSRSGFVLQLAAVAAGLLVIDAFGPEGISPFIYFQF